MDGTSERPAEETWEDIPEDIMALSSDEILTRIRLIDNDLKVCNTQRRKFQWICLIELWSNRSCARRRCVCSTSRMS